MPQAYCFRCQRMREISDPEQYSMKDGRPGIRGTCSVCGANLARRGPLPPQ